MQKEVVVPTFKSKPDYWREGFTALFDQLQANLHPPNFLFHHYHAYPAPKFPGVFLWDSAFIAEAWKPFDIEISKEIIRSVLQHQKADGRVPHVRHWFGESKLTQPPLLSWAVQRIYATDKDVAFLKEVFPKLKKYNAWLFKNRRLNNGLFFWKKPYESGLDNAPRFSNVQESKTRETTSIAAVDFSSYMVMDCKALATIAKTLNIPSEVTRYTNLHSKLAKTMNATLWNEDKGMYYDLDMLSNKHITINTIASFFPFTAKVGSKQQFNKAKKVLFNTKKFNTKLPFPCVAHDEPSFKKDTCAGAVWINTTYLTLLALEHYAPKESDLYKKRVVEGVYKTYYHEGKFFEFYDPDEFSITNLTRKKGNFYKQITLGSKPVAKFAGWTALTNNVALELTQNPYK